MKTQEITFDEQGQAKILIRESPESAERDILEVEKRVEGINDAIQIYNRQKQLSPLETEKAILEYLTGRKEFVYKQIQLQCGIVTTKGKTLDTSFLGQAFGVDVPAIVRAVEIIEMNLLKKCDFDKKFLTFTLNEKAKNAIREKTKVYLGPDATELYFEMLDIIPTLNYWVKKFQMHAGVIAKGFRLKVYFDENKNPVFSPNLYWLELCERQDRDIFTRGDEFLMPEKQGAEAHNGEGTGEETEKEAISD